MEVNVKAFYSHRLYMDVAQAFLMSPPLSSVQHKNILKTLLNQVKEPINPAHSGLPTLSLSLLQIVFKGMLLLNVEVVSLLAIVISY